MLPFLCTGTRSLSSLLLLGSQGIDLFTPTPRAPPRYLGLGELRAAHTGPLAEVSRRFYARSESSTTSHIIRSARPSFTNVHHMLVVNSSELCVVTFAAAPACRRQAILRRSREAYLQRQREGRHTKVHMYRTYRTGELPGLPFLIENREQYWHADVQFKHSELIMPMQALARRDTTFARLLFQVDHLLALPSPRGVEERGAHTCIMPHVPTA